MAGPDTLEFTDDGFEEQVLQSDTPVLVDFWAEWCQPCKALGPIVDELATEYKDRVKIGKLDIDSNQKSAVKYGVSAIPTLILFKNGQVHGNPITGLRSKKDLASEIDSALA